MKRSVFVPAFLAIAGIAIVAGCGGGSGSGTNPAVPSQQQQQQTAAASFTILIPEKKADSSGERKPEYVSPSTQSASFNLPGMGSPQVVALASPSPNCTAVTGGLQCTASFQAPIGVNQTLTVKTYASTDGTGTPLSIGSTTVTVTVGTTNTLSVTLGGVVASYTLVLNPTSMTALTTQAITATYTALDGGGNAIVGTPVDTTGAAVTPGLTSDDTHSTTTIGSLSGNAWTVTETNPPSAETINFTVASTGATGGTAALTVNPAATASPSPSPTASPSPSPTASPIEAITDGNFSNGLTGWYNCFATHAGYSAPINPSPSPAPTTGQSVGNPTPVPLDISVQTTTPSGAAPPSGNANFGLVGSSSTGAGTPKGQSGLCQDVTVPLLAPTLTFAVYEGGNDAFTNSDSEVDVYSAGSFGSNTNGVITTSAPAVTLMAEDNCYDSVQNNKLYFSTPWGSGTHAPVVTARYAWCPYSPGGTGTPSGAPGGGTVSLGGYWYSRSFDMTSYAGSTVTLFFGVWRSSASANGTSGQGNYYNYAYFDNIKLTGS